MVQRKPWGSRMEDFRCKALIADDDEYFRIAIKSILIGRLGLSEVIETASFDEALERMDEESDGLGIGLFDLSMPGMGSAANLRAVRELFPHVRVAVVSASRRRTDILMALEAGVHGYMPKTMGVEELARAIRSIMDGVIYVPALLAELPPDDGASRFAPSATALPHLTPRQRDVLTLLVEGRSNKEIARSLDLGEGTVKIHLAALFRNLGVANRAAAAVLGSRILGRLPGSAESSE
ncbi:response regulator transcription factor [Inquilinus sp. OTU3971]|uniref:response regulator transcription factor n=1 Tax=Inquilinus sp. OTU3971 TaxID=3043855 RepID=UPI00313F15E3